MQDPISVCHDTCVHSAYMQFNFESKITGAATASVSDMESVPSTNIGNGGSRISAAVVLTKL